MQIPKLKLDLSFALDLEVFKQIDYHALDKYQLTIELMMAQAGLNLARLTAQDLKQPASINVIVGPGNNGGGGLVAARRLAAWGYKVGLIIPLDPLEELPNLQLERAEAFGVSTNALEEPAAVIDALFGFSQRLPLNEKIMELINSINELKTKRISLDIPTGLDAKKDEGFFKADVVCTLAAPKKILANPALKAKLYVADLGIPKAVFEDLELPQPIPFEQSPIFEFKFN